MHAFPSHQPSKPSKGFRYEGFPLGRSVIEGSTCGFFVLVSLFRIGLMKVLVGTQTAFAGGKGFVVVVLEDQGPRTVKGMYV